MSEQKQPEKRDTQGFFLCRAHKERHNEQKFVCPIHGTRKEIDQPCWVNEPTFSKCHDWVLGKLDARDAS